MRRPRDTRSRNLRSQVDALSRNCIRIVLAGFLLGCSGSGPGGADSAWIGDSLPPRTNATRLTTIDATGWSGIPIVSPLPTVIIGTGLHGPDDELGWVSGVAVDAARHIYVADPASTRIRVYSADGTFIRDIGRKGQGPGEFSALHGEQGGRAVNGIAISNDTLFAIDARLMAFDTSGALLYSTDPDVGYNTAASVTASERGLIVDRRISLENVRVRLQFNVYDPASDAEKPWFSALERFLDFGNQRLLFRKPTPLPELPFTIARNGRAYMATGDSFHITVIGDAGYVEREYVAAVGRVKVSDEDVRDVGTNLERLVRERTTIIEMPALAAMIERGPRAVYRSAIGALVVSDEGALLVQRPDVSQRPYDKYHAGAEIEWIALDSTGAATGRVSLPGGFQARVLSGCRLYGVDEQDDGAQLVVMYDLQQIVSCEQRAGS